MIFVSKFSGTPEVPPQGGGQPQMGVDVRQVTILSKGDWDRIQQQLHRKQIEEDRLRRIKEERENRKNQSKELVKNWGNTIAVSTLGSYSICFKVYAGIRYIIANI